MVYPMNPPEERAAYLYGLLTPCGKFKIGRTTNYMRALGKQHELKNGKVAFLYYNTDYFLIDRLETLLVKVVSYFAPTAPNSKETFDLNYFMENEPLLRRINGWVKKSKTTKRKLRDIFNNMWSQKHGYSDYAPPGIRSAIREINKLAASLKSPRILGVIA